MSAWHIAREQWVAWIADGPDALLRRPSGPLDEVDAALAERLARNPFPTGDDETISRPGLAEVPDKFESMTTLVRNTVDDEDDDATRVRPDPGALEVGLHAPEDGLEVSLQPVGHELEPSSVSLAGETLVMQAPLPAAAAPEAGASDAESLDEGAWREPASSELGERVTPPDGGPEDGLFIPTLTRTVIAPAPVEPPPEEEPAMEEAPPDEWPPHDALPPVVSGQTVIGPPPSPPPDYGDAAISTSSGLITSDPEEAAQTLIRGEIPAREEPSDAAVPRKSKVVIDPAASGVLSAVYDEDDEDDVEPEYAPVDVEPDELDADDLLEDEAPVVEAAPPPAPSRPPPAPEPEVTAPRRPALDLGPPPPPLPSASLDAALAALPAAPSLDDGWQVDLFADHFGALVSPLRSAAAGAEADFIVHCAGLHPGVSVLDVGCGDGSHSVALAARGLVVTGLDASPVQLMRASQAAQASGVAVHLVAGDMRQPPVEGPFDAIVCLGGTLGMHTDEDDRIALKQMRDRLVPGGRIMLHVLNRDYIVARLPARSWWQGQGCLILDEAQMFAPTSRVHVHRTVVFETGKQFEHNLGLRIYGLTELVQMCAQVGLQVLEYSGSRHTRGRFYGAASSEIWLLAQRGD